MALGSSAGTFVPLLGLALAWRPPRFGPSEELTASASRRIRVEVPRWSNRRLAPFHRSQHFQPQPRKPVV